MPSLARILTEDDNGDARIQAALALGKMGPAAAAAIPALTRALDEDELPQVRMYSVLALSHQGTQARPAVAILIRAIQNRANRTNLARFTFTIQDMAALVLGRATVGTSEGVAVLIEALEPPHVEQAATRRLRLWERSVRRLALPCPTCLPCSTMKRQKSAISPRKRFGRFAQSKGASEE